MHEEGKRSKCEPCQMNRRQLLRVMGSSAGALFLVTTLPGCGNPKGSPPTGPVSAGNVSSLKLGTLRILSGDIVVGQDSKGIYAMSAICTHAGCVLDDSAGTISAGLTCPCHGSAFDGDGNVLRGPASSPLQHYQVSIASDGTITADGSQPVSATTRIPAP